MGKKWNPKSCPRLETWRTRYDSDGFVWEPWLTHQQSEKTLPIQKHGVETLTRYRPWLTQKQGVETLAT